MPTLNDILTANGDYTPVSGYPVDDKYTDDSPVINVYDRTIGEIVGDTSTSGENVSQYLTFRIPRHPDHYDLIENGTNIRILYRLEDDTGEDVVPVNVVANEDYIIFGWKIPLVVTVNPGVVTFIIHAYKSENNIITYHYKTLPKTYMILETMETDVVVPEIEMYNLAEAYARGTITDVFGQTRPVEESEPGYHDNSKYYKELAGTSKIDAETAKNAAEAAQVAAETAKKAAEDARDQAVAIVGGEYVSYGQTQSLNDTQKNKARENIGATEPNGYYPNMTVGLSENFVGTGEPTRRTFNYDTAGGSADISDGNAEIEKMYGDTVAWNQMLQNGNFASTSYWSPTDVTGFSVANNIGSFTATAQYGNITSGFNTIGGHKFLATAQVKITSGYAEVYFGGSSIAHKQTTITGAFETLNAIFDPAYTGNYSFPRIRDARASGWDEVQVKNVMYFDLTQMFGSTIADYIYSLEQSQAGAGVAWFKKLFPKDYYPYDEGTLLNVNPAGIKTVGFNAYDKATGKAELIGGNQYQITGTYTSLSYSTGEVLTPDSTGCFTPTKTGELTVTGGGENTCVHLTWSGYRNGDYEDYWTRTRDINIQPYFPDGLKRAGTVYDEISKDKAIKRIGVVNLGALEWTDGGSMKLFFSKGIANLIKKPASNNDILTNFICLKPYVGTSYNHININTYNMICISEPGNIGICPAENETYLTVDDFKASLSDIYLYYELETPVETQIDPPLNLLYQVSDFGTEQFLGAGATEPKTLPIIADIVYDVNYRDTIKNLPKNYAKARGYYPDLYTGLADNLIDRKGNGTPQEISYRTSCGDDSIADDGNGIIQSIFGNTVVGNQLVKNGNFADTSNWELNNPSSISFSASGNIGKVTITNNTAGRPNISQKITKPIVGHKYLLTCGVKITTSNTPNPIFSFLFGNAFECGKIFDTSWHDYEKIVSVTLNDYDGFHLYTSTTVDNYSVNDTVEYRNAMAIDLTQMFGAGNEPSTLDDPRIKWIKDYANEYPEYNSGELISYNGSGIKTVGFNQWDEEWELGIFDTTTGINVYAPIQIRSKNLIKILPNTVYYNGSKTSFEDGGGLWIIFYDSELNVIENPPSNGLASNGNSIRVTNQTFTTPSNAHYMKFYATRGYGTTYNHDICINLSWSGYRNGEYEPYWSRILNLPISTYFPDGMKSAGSVRDELTKDKAVKRIGVVDLGTLDWTYDSGGFKTSIIGRKYVSGNEKNNYVLPLSYTYQYDLIDDKTISFSMTTTNIWIKDSSYATTDAFKTAMSGVMLYYELAEPIETTITPPLDLTYKVADFGTEESIAEGKSTPFNGIIKYSDDFVRGLVNMPKNYDTTASLDALAASLSAMLTSALDGTVTITRGAYDQATKKYEWNCQFTKNQVN